MLIMIFSCIALAVAVFCFYAIKRLSYWKNRGVQQGRFLALLSDNFGLVMRSQTFPEMVEYVYNKCPGTRYSGSYQFFTPALTIRDPELLKQITIKDFDHFVDHRSIVLTEAEPLWGKNLFALTGKKWRDMRTILSPSFTSSKMKMMFVLMNECAENFVKHFLAKNEDTVTFEMKDAFTRFTNDVIATTAFGVKVDSLANPDNEFYTMGKELTSFGGFWKMLIFFCLLLLPSFFKLFKVSLFSRKVRIFFSSLIEGTIKAREEKGIIRPDMIHLLMEAKKGNQKQEKEQGTIDTGYSTALESDIVSGKEQFSREITNEDIAAQALIFFFAGFDSVSSLMCFAAYELAVDQDIQGRLRREIEDASEECNGELKYESLLKLKYMDMVISETLRKWPNAVGIDRVCTKPYTIEPTNSTEKRIYLEKGEILWLPIYAIHRDPQYYPDPSKFDPERFNDKNKEKIKPYTYLPFGLGPRNCIGSRFALLEVKTILFHLLSNFKIVPVEKSSIPVTIDKKTIGLNAEGGFWFGLKRIS